MGFSQKQAKLQTTTSTVQFTEDEEIVPDQNEEKEEKGFDFLQWIFGWILDPITAIIDGIISIVKFVINAIKFCINLPWCIKWYIFYMIGTILYLPITLLVMFFGLRKIEKKVWKARDSLHNLIVCYTGYSIISYSDEIRDGCFFEDIKKRKCPNPNLPNAGFSEFFDELFKGFFSFSYIAVVTSISFFLFFAWIFYYFVKPLLVRFYSYMMDFIKNKMGAVSNYITNKKAPVSDMAAETTSKVDSGISKSVNKYLPIPLPIGI